MHALLLLQRETQSDTTLTDEALVSGEEKRVHTVTRLSRSWLELSNEVSAFDYKDIYLSLYFPY